MLQVSAYAQEEYRKDFSLNISGHYSNLFSASKETAGKRFTSDLQRIRLEFNLFYGDSLKGLFMYDHTFQVSNFIKTSDFTLAQNRARKQFLDLGDELEMKGNFRWEHLLYRAYINYHNDDLELLLGRQQIPWGLGRFWSPTDLFNPYEPLSLEKEERQGVDALNIKIFRGNNCWEIACAPQDNARDSTSAIRVLSLLGEQEVGLIAAESKEDEIFGMHFLTNVNKASLRAEGTFTNAQDESDYSKFIFNIDYTFPNSLYFLGEYFYNGQGRRSKSTYQRLRQTVGEIDFMGQDFLGFIMGYDINSLVRFDNYIIYSLRDKSLALNPEIKWSVTKNSDLLLGSQCFLGKSDTEFGQYHNMSYIRWKGYF